MALVLQQLINGLTLGAVYGLIAIGYTMVYGIIGMINFAHGDIYMVSAFIAVTAFTLLAALGISSIPLALGVVLLFGYLGLFTGLFAAIVLRLGIWSAPLVWPLVEFARAATPLDLPQAPPRTRAGIRP